MVTGWLLYLQASHLHSSPEEGEEQRTKMTTPVSIFLSLNLKNKHFSRTITSKPLQKTFAEISLASTELPPLDTRKTRKLIFRFPASVTRETHGRREFERLSELTCNA